MIKCLIMRRFLAALLVMPLLAMTSWASACDLSCSLEPFHSICRLATAPSGQQISVSSDMAMDPNMAMPDETSLMPQMGAGNGPAHAHALSCTHNPCNET